jgi:hypothetical protein
LTRSCPLIAGQFFSSPIGLFLIYQLSSTPQHSIGSNHRVGELTDAALISEKFNLHIDLTRLCYMVINQKILQQENTWLATGIGGWAVSRLNLLGVSLMKMNRQLEDRDLTQLYEPYLLVCESNDQHDSLRHSLQELIGPKNFIEHVWTAALVDGEHELGRLRRAKARIIRSHTGAALRNLLRLVTDVYESDQIDYLVAKWFTNKSIKRTVSRLLRDFGLDETSVDSEALRLSMEDIAVFDNRIAQLEARRDRILRRIEDHRAGLATELMPKSGQRPVDDGDQPSGPG